jgi:sulfite exporter TauE/SafE
MNLTSRIITGGLMIFIGLSILINFFKLNNYFFHFLGLFFLIIGLIIFFNEKEDFIEKINLKKKISI